MAGGLRDSSLTRVRPFFGNLITADATGQSWLPQLLGAMPNARAVLGDLVGEPGTLLSAITTTTRNGLLGCFEFPVSPMRGLVQWFIENPDALQWPASQMFSPETTRVRRALVLDDPPGSRTVAQDDARRLAATRGLDKGAWWRFEGTSRLDCVLLTDRLVLTIEGKRTEPLSAATAWYPSRSQLVRNLEAARFLARGRVWGSLLMSEELVPEGTDAALEQVLTASAPHLDAASRAQLHAHYLGNLTWADACATVGLPREVLPNTTADL